MQRTVAGKGKRVAERRAVERVSRTAALMDGLLGSCLVSLLVKTKAERLGQLWVASTAVKKEC